MIAATGAERRRRRRIILNREVKLVVGYAPGGITNTLARILAEKMSDVLGQRMIVEKPTGRERRHRHPRGETRRRRTATR